MTGGARIRIAALVALTAAAAVLGARREACLPGAVRDDARAARVLSLIHGTREGKELLRRGRPIGPLCFGEARGITPAGTMHVDARASDPAVAAYVGHLLLHRVEAMPGAPPRDREGCALWLLRAKEAERRAAAVEARLAGELGTARPDSALQARALEYAARCEARP